MNRLLIKLFFIASFLFAGSVQAQTTTFCQPVKLTSQGQNLLLNPAENDTAKIYFFKNTTPQGIWIDHPVLHRSASAGWSAYLQTGNWSALAVDRKNFAISCAAIKPGKVDSLNCSKALFVCSPAIKSSTAKQKGTYWVAEDLKWDALLKKVQLRGFHFN